MTPLNVSSRSDQVTSTPPATIQLASGITCGDSLARMSRNKMNAEHSRQQEGAAGDQLCTPVADHPSKETGDYSGEKRQENDGDGQAVSLSSC